MSSTPDWDTPPSELDFIALKENIMALAAAWCEASDREELTRLHDFLRGEDND